MRMIKIMMINLILNARNEDIFILAAIDGNIRHLNNSIITVTSFIHDIVLFVQWIMALKYFFNKWGMWGEKKKK